MFVCSIGDHVVPSGIPPVRVVTEIRERDYRNDNGLTSSGWEIVREEILCPEHAAEVEPKGRTNELRRSID